MTLYDTVGVLLTRKCSALCDICSLSCSPYEEEVFEEDALLRIIDEMGNIPSVGRLNISGGEPFLFAELLEKAVGNGRFLPDD